MVLKVAVFILFNVVLIQSQSKTCCVPKQWQGIEGLNIGYLKDGKGGLIEGYIKVVYDETNEKLAANSTIFIDEKKEESRVILDYSRKRQYVIYNGHCNTTRLETEFPSGCIPEDAKKLDVTHLGAGEDELDVSIYDIKLPGMRATITVTNEACVPVGEIVRGTSKGVGFNENIGFIGIDTTIDPSAFDVPSICDERLLYRESVRKQDNKSPVLRYDVRAHGVPEHMERFVTKSSFLGF